MSVLERLRLASKIVQRQGIGWCMSRLSLEIKRRIGVEAVQYRSRAWKLEEWRQWVDKDTVALGEEHLLSTWRSSTGAAWGCRRSGPQWEEAHMGSLGPSGRQVLVHAADAILAGKFRLFSHHEVDMGFPPDWTCNPLLGKGAQAPSSTHWSKMPMRSSDYGDIKFVWELSRFSWAYVLARAYAATADDRYAEGFWQLWLDWIAKNPPHGTVNWKCGQECALRVMAVSFAVQICASSAATTPARFATHLGAVAALSDRVYKGRAYAVLQANNHSMSEASGLYTAGVFYPILKHAVLWKRCGWQSLTNDLIRLIRPDGTFTQKSHNYHRVMLHNYLWALSVAEEAGDHFEGEARRRMTAACDYIVTVTDPLSGGSPNFGPNDGALVLHLQAADYTDYRPVAKSAFFWVHRARLETSAEGAEELLWLFGEEAASCTKTAQASYIDVDHEKGGIYVRRQSDSWLLVRAEDFKERPGQADQLHVDIWWRGLNIARDPGSYLYFGPPELNKWFKGSRCHNTVTVDGLDQMEQGPNFLWINFARGARLSNGQDDRRALALTHSGYLRLAVPVKHVRFIQPKDGGWTVVDSLSSGAEHEYCLHWLLPLCSWTRDNDVLTLQTEAGPYYIRVSVDRGTVLGWDVVSEQIGITHWGWESLYYGAKTPALSLVTKWRADNIRVTTEFSPVPFEST